MRTAELFETPIRQKKVRDGVIAYQYANGVINIAGEKYVMYSMTQAVKHWRSKNLKTCQGKQ